MKKMIILGSCLVAGAVLYGFADYLHTDKKVLIRMYDNVPQKTDTTAIGRSPVEQPEAPGQKIRLEEFSRSALVQPLQDDSTELITAPKKKKH